MDEEKTLLFNLGPVVFDGTIILMCLLTIAIVFGLVFWASRDLKLKPKGKQNVLEWVIDFVSSIVKDNLSSKELPVFQLFMFTVFSFLIVANNLGLVTKIVVSNDISLWKSPTADAVVALTFSLIIALFCNYMGVKRFGFKGYLVNSFLRPVPFIAPMKIIEEFTNLLTLGLRLYGNIFAGEVLLSLICKFGLSHGPFLVPLGIFLEMLWTGFSIFISCIQAYIFIILTNSYLSHKILAEH
ncbi:MAG: F0F1 ATP synthase subunit A [Lactobacillales bacterium]|jgi:F-type H+-transporting ATPase subunit a|nr:F0F1 ATP synthase subunit A [Lactobacillales bacterium]